MDLVLERIELRTRGRPRIARRLIARQRPPDRVAMQPGPAMNLPDRQAAHEVQPPDLRPLLHSDHPGPPELALRKRTQAPRTPGRSGGPVFNRRRWSSFHPAPTLTSDGRPRPWLRCRKQQRSALAPRLWRGAPPIAALRRRLSLRPSWRIYRRSSRPRQLVPDRPDAAGQPRSGTFSHTCTAAHDGRGVRGYEATTRCHLRRQPLLQPRELCKLLASGLVKVEPVHDIAESRRFGVVALSTLMCCKLANDLGPNERQPCLYGQ